MHARTTAFVLASVCALSLLNCKRDEPKPIPAASASPASATAQVVATQSAAPPAPAASSAAAALPEVWEKAVKEGHSLDKTWTPAYSIYRKPGGTGVSILEAYAYCEGHGKALCSEAQYRRACTEEPALGKIETWTASGDVAADQVAVLGGDDCTSKQLVVGTEKKPGRSTLCCDRALGVRTEYKSADFLIATVRHVGAYENALKARDPLVLGDLYGEKVIFQNKVHDRARLLDLHRAYWKSVPQQWTQFDYCRVTMQSGKDAEGADDKQFQTDCAGLFRIGPEVHYAMQRIIKGKAAKGAAAIIFIGEPSSSSAPSGIDMKTAIEKGGIGEDLAAAASGSASPISSAAAAGGSKEKKVRVGVLMTVD